MDPHSWSKQDCFAPVLSQLEHCTLLALALRTKCIPKTGNRKAFFQSVLPLIGDKVATSRNQKVTAETDRLRKYTTYAECVRHSTQQTKDTLKNKDTLKEKDMNGKQIPASSRSFMVIVLIGFEKVMRAFWMSLGHWILPTIKPLFFVIPMRTPSTPIQQESQYPRKSGRPLMSWRMWVGMADTCL